MNEPRLDPPEDRNFEKACDDWHDLKDSDMLEALIAWLGPAQFKLFEEQWLEDRVRWYDEKGWIE